MNNKSINEIRNDINIDMNMTIQEAIEARHSVRAYKEQPLAEEIALGIAKYHFEKPEGSVPNENLNELPPLNFLLLIDEWSLSN